MIFLIASGIAVDLNRVSTHTTVTYPAASVSPLLSSRISKSYRMVFCPLIWGFSRTRMAAPCRIGFENFENASTRGIQI